MFLSASGEAVKTEGSRGLSFAALLQYFSVNTEDWSNVSTRLDVLDMLFLFWLLAAFLVVAAVNLYLRVFGYPRKKAASPYGGVSTSSLAPGGGESTQWVNAVLAWVHAHTRDTPLVVQSWMHGVNEELDKQIDDYNIKIERVDRASHVPRIHSVKAEESGASSNLTLSAAMEASEVILDVSAISLASASHKLSAEAIVTRLKGQLKIVCAKNVRDEVQANICFFSAPEMELKLQPKKIDGSFNLAAIQQQLKQAISHALTTYTVAGRTEIGSKVFERAGDVMTRDRVSPMKATLHEYDITKKTGPSVGTGAGYSKGKWMLVKVMKANGLGDKEFGCAGPYCVITIDEPRQEKKTSVVQNTVNPFWDEQFIMEVNDKTKQVQFELFDQDHRRSTPAFLGRASVPVAQLMRMPSSHGRQLLPLTGKPGSTTTSGSVTVECMLVDSPEAHGDSLNDLDLSIPRMTVETSQSMTPGGGIITATTTTTERPYYTGTQPRNTTVMVEHMEGAGLSDSEESSAFTPTLTGSQLGAHEVGIGAGGQHSPGASMARPSLMVTSPSGDDNRPNNQHPESRLYYDYPSTSVSPASTTEGNEKQAEKKKSGFAAAFKRRFQRKPKSRSMSADRTSSLKEGSTLQPPSRHSRANEAVTDIPEDGLRKKRSSSLSSSIRRLFKGKKKEGQEGAAATGRSRESSVSRHSTRSAQGALTFEPQHRQATSAHAYNGPPHEERQDSPDLNDFPYSSSVPARSPMYQYYSQS